MVAQSRPRTVSKAASTPHCSSADRCPARAPRRPTSTAPTCSTRTRERMPSTSISGRNEAGRALVEVGATKTIERGRKASDWTTTPNRRPFCSCPTPLGSRNAKTSPRRTETLHELGDGQHLRSIGLVCFESGDFSCESSLVVETRCCLHQGGTDRFGPAHTGGLELGQRPQSFIVESNRYRLSHGANVSRYVIRVNGRSWVGSGGET